MAVEDLRGTVTKAGLRPTVLVVDDEVAVRRLLALTLVDAGYEVVETNRGDKALDLIAHSSFDLVLLDNRMPGLSGVDVLERLRADPHGRTLPVILVTGADELSERVRGLEAGATDYVIKPFEPDELLARVHAQLRGQHAWQEVVRARFDERATVAEALSRAAAEATVEDMAASICDELTTLDRVLGVALVWFVSDRSATTLAAAGDGVWGLEVDQPVPRALARYLQMRATIGPWLEWGDIDEGGEPSSGALLVSGTAACAPLGGRSDPVGLLMLASDREASTTDATAILSAAIDFAGVSGSLLWPKLDARRRAHTERMGLTSVVLKEAFTPHFQPIVTLEHRTTIGFEALTRFTDGTPPDVRFAEATRVGLGLDLEQATIRAALAAAPFRLPARRWLSLNVSPSMLLASDALHQALEHSGRDIVLELTEHEPVDDYEALRSAIDGLGLDVLLSVDDAGSGFASLRHILILEPAFMKLDRTWVHTIDTDPARRALVAGLVSFAGTTGCRLIAEGIETEAEATTLTELGVELGQGYLLGYPKPVWS